MAQESSGPSLRAKTLGTLFRTHRLLAVASVLAGAVVFAVVAVT
jgi:hypothetical protein